MNTLPFSISDQATFEKEALDVFRYQAVHCDVYREFIPYLGVNPNNVHSIDSIPFLPIQFFKSHTIVSGKALSSKLS